MSAGSGLEAEIEVRRDDGFALDVRLSLEAGRTCALLGPNGAGKSTVVDVLAGLRPLDRGHVTLNGRTLDRREPGAGPADVFVPPEDRAVGVVFQQYLLFDHLTVEENVAFGPRSAGTPRAMSRSIAARWLDELGIADLATRRPATLSGGQAQRVSVARALATRPSLLLLDEPLAALDVTTRSDLRRTLRRHLDGFSGPRLLITHDPADAFLLADTVHVIEHGRLTQSGTVDSIRTRPATPYVAALAGTNLLTGTNSAGALSLDEHPQGLQTADTHTEGAVLITIHPTAISVHRQQPHGSPRNTWRTRVAHLEPLGEVTRITLDAPLPLAVDITPASTEALALAPGEDVWASVKATEISVTPVT